jgi:D-sedoheptulose 7-phosphate isomerase
MLEQQIEKHFIDSADLKYQVAQSLAKPIAQATEALLACVTNGGKVLVCGNGACAAAAQHFSAQFVGRYERERPALAAIALTADGAVLTAIANDHGPSHEDFRLVFAKQISALGSSGDVLLVISTSGNCANLTAAIEAAKLREMGVIALTGQSKSHAGSNAGGDAGHGAAGSSGGKIAALLSDTDVHLCVPHECTARIHEVHLLTLHCLCDGVDTMLVG